MSRNISANTMKTNNILKIVIGLFFTALLASDVPEIHAETCQKVLDTISEIIEAKQPLDTAVHTSNKREEDVPSEEGHYTGKEGQRVVNLPISQTPEGALSNRYKLSVNILLPEKKLIKAGVYEPELKVAIRNQDPLARPVPFPIALREVYWEGQKEEQQNRPVNERLKGWLRPLMGSAGMNKDGTIEFVSHMAIAHTLDNIPITEFKFETGLIRPDNELIIPLPLKPNNKGEHKLVIDFVEIPEFGALLIEEKTDEYYSRFVPISTYEEQIHERVCRAYNPATCEEGAEELPIIKAIFHIQMKLDDKLERDKEK